MATSLQTSHMSNFATDAEFRAWAQKIHDGLAAVGLVQTSDTGQIDLTTVARPGAINTSAGYEVWRFSDADQGTAPIFFKLEYGTGGSTSTPSIWITVGTSSDGAGTIGGQAGTRTQISDAATATNYDSNFCFVDGALAITLHGNGAVAPANSRPIMLAIERERDENGDVHSSGDFFWCACSANNNWKSQWIPRTGTIPAVGSTGNGPFVPAAGLGQTTPAGFDKSLHPMILEHGHIRQPALSYVCAHRDDFTTGDTLTVDRYGQTRTYKVTISPLNAMVPSIGGTTTWRVCTLWE